jgi:hypothetical protein
MSTNAGPNSRAGKPLNVGDQATIVGTITAVAAPVAPAPAPVAPAPAA